MQNLKFGVVVCGLLGLVGCFLPMMSGISFFDTRNFDAANFYIIAAGYAAAAVMGAMGIAKGMQRWMSIIAIVGFSVVLLRMRGEVVELLQAGIGAKLMGVAALAGLALAILTTVKPEPVK
ncbi:MAG: hypothetical protein M4D80_10695 [Myxococcota bacterium]|nr:hypothetical protein [Deltaproteobacteria bacterium]MDQ3335624.1 hypothetical protein [Myxococcota bacterium]